MPASSLCPYNRAVTTIYPGRLSVGLLHRQQHQSIYKTKVRQRNEMSYGMKSIHKNCLSFSLRRSCLPVILMAKFRVIDSLMVGCSPCLIQTVDTDIVILVGKFHYLHTLNTSVNIWVAFVTGKYYKYLSINSTVYGALVNK